MADHHHLAERIADVPWLAASRRAHTNWPVRLALLGTGCAALAVALEVAPTTAATVGSVLIGTLLAATGLVMGAAYGRVVAGLVAALDVGYQPHWLAARLDVHEGDPAAFAVELEQLAERQPAH